MIQILPTCDSCGRNCIRKWVSDRTRWFWSCPDWPRCGGSARDPEIFERMRRDPHWGMRAQGLRNRGVHFLYHFTDVANLPSIAQHDGLLSWEEQGRRGFRAPSPGGTATSRQLAAENGDTDRISTSIAPNTPMLAVRLRDGHRMAMILLTPAVTEVPGVLFTSTNAVANDHWRAEPPKGFGAIDFKIATGPVDIGNPAWKRAVQAEVLVPRHIPLEGFVAVAFRTEMDRDASLASAAFPPTLPLVVEPDLFPRSGF